MRYEARASKNLTTVSILQELQHTSVPAMPTSCPSRQAIMRGLRPNAQQKIICGVCSGRCIYCDIWKLASLIFTRVPLTRKFATLSPSRSSRAESPTHRDVYDWEASERMIDAQFQTQRARLASIMSICTVDGVDAVEGLRMAHDRCLGSVKELLYQERVLESTIIKSSQHSSSQRPNDSRRPSQTCASYYNQDERRPSIVGIAM